MNKLYHGQPISFDFKNGSNWLQLFQCGANFSHLAKVVAQEKKIARGNPEGH